ncbi:aminotransferase class I/II-fold pyridoxal phosphate-dependent enzyme [Rhodophyticola sp. CCM32]|uniref:aminotransferase class I/II-fold pyridoxal phosphate-dependent enzyme n=1 Tax=Rhodophyticola sp. CCM32 TaxID=2916397 RepID=UPI00107FC6E5|nr:aminotransferase class I/II-fold pyridoxal phosphate-dependent enzyme [Rhodophyticola sp. CCM32]QBY00311.1 aminotransferase class I/II-fold pyridoxal phosphate-dependent enzyme [Rhodophyticola sp. CCM32]
MPKQLPDSAIRPEVANLPDYNAGVALDRFRDTYGIECVAKLDSNESPLGPSPNAIKAMQDAALGVARYPDAANQALRALIAKQNKTVPENVIIGNGSEDLIGAIFRAVIRPDDHVVTICPSFGLHEFGALTFGATVTKVVFKDDWSFPVAGLCEALDAETRILIFSSPSNPVGPAIKEQEFRDILAHANPDTLICLDEAYVEFIDAANKFDALAILAEARQPWIALRTFSKAYGLAGARVGYGIASDPAFIKALMKTRNPFGVNALAGSAAIVALADQTHLSKVLNLAKTERARIAAALEAMGFVCAPSQTNFVFFNTGVTATKVAEALRLKGILIKAWLEPPFLNWARVTSGTPQENDIFLAALSTIKSELDI